MFVSKVSSPSVLPFIFKNSVIREPYSFERLKFLISALSSMLTEKRRGSKVL